MNIFMSSETGAHHTHWEKYFLFVGFFPLPLLPGESQYSSAFFRELQRLVQALVQVPLCLQTCWSTPLLFMQQDDLCVVRVG